MIKYIPIVYPGFKDFEKIQKMYHIKSDFEKSAYEMADPVKEFIETIKPSKDSNYYWVNAMGAGETYGPNSRGDYFPRNELIEHHASFVETPARVYIQHRNKDPQYSLGEVVYSHFNPDSDRVELIERVDWPLVFKFAPDWIRYGLQKDAQLNTSMGCKVAYDECNHCGNRAKYASDYCDHAKYHMNQFIDGKKVYVRNVEPNFFDNSFVQRGADRTARVLSKVAGEFDEFIIKKDEEAKHYFPGLTLTDPKSKIAEEIESNFKNYNQFTKEYMNELCSFELEDILGTTKIAGIELSPFEYQYIVLKKLGLEKEAEERFEKNEVFTIKKEYSEDVVLKLNYDVLEKLSSAVFDRSLYRPFVLYRNLIKTAEIDSPIYTTFNNELGDILAKGYTSYYNKDLTKEAGIIESILLSMFLTLPEMIRLKESDKRRQLTEKTNNAGIKQVSKSSTIPHLPETTNMVNPIPVFVSNAPVYNVAKSGFYNPVFNNPFLQGKKEAIDLAGLGQKAKGFVRTGMPLGVGIGSTLYLAGKERERQETGDPKAGTGPASFARKHPLITAGALSAGGMAVTRKLFKKSNSPEYDGDVSDYKEYLMTIHPKKIVEVINEIPEQIFSKIIK